MVPQVREYTDPSCDKLLPDMAPEHRGRIKTLVLDLDDLLVHKEWSRARGWQVGQQQQDLHTDALLFVCRRL